MITMSISIAEPTPLALQGTTTQSSCTNADGTATITASGGTPSYTYLWSDGQTTATAIGLVAGSYTVTVTDANGCTQTSTLTVTDINAPTSAITGSSDVTCFGDGDGWAVVTVSGGTGPFQYAWNTTVPVNNDTLQGVGGGLWSVTITDALGCTTTASVTLNEPAVLAATMDSVAPSCFGLADGTGAVTVTGGTPNYSYVWSSAATTSTITGLTAGAYSVTVTDANGCTVAGAMSITDPLPVNAGFIATPGMPAQLQIPWATATFSNQSSNATSYAWAFGDGSTSTDVNPSHTYTTVGDYCVTLVASDAAGCTDTVEQCNYNVFQEELDIPNTFTPNGDGSNDVFQIKGIELFPNNHLTVFNRWGNLVYEKDQYNNTWVGENYKNGAALPDGAYFYIFKTGIEGQEEIMGDVVIFR
jgi:gliding motility-associated-like protein